MRNLFPVLSHQMTLVSLLTRLMNRLRISLQSQRKKYFPPAVSLRHLFFETSSGLAPKERYPSSSRCRHSAMCSVLFSRKVAVCHYSFHLVSHIDGCILCSPLRSSQWFKNLAVRVSFPSLDSGRAISPLTHHS